jgi:hypothetical protein
MKTKKVITLSLGDLKDLGILPRKEKKKQKRKGGKKVKIVFVDANTGAIIGGSKSDSSHMTGYSQQIPQAPQFTNTANVNSAIQQANLEAIERANRKPEETKGVMSNNQLVKQDSHLLKLADAIEHRFNDIVPYIERINPLVEQSQKHQDMITQGIGVVNKLQRDFYSLSDNFGITNPSLTSDQFITQGNPKPEQTTTNAYTTPARPMTRFDALDTDTDKTPQGIPLSLLKEIRSVNKLGSQYEKLINPPVALPKDDEDEETDIGNNIFKDVFSPQHNSPPQTPMGKGAYEEIPEEPIAEENLTIEELQKKASELLKFKKMTTKMDGRSSIYRKLKKFSNSTDKDVLNNLIKDLKENNPNVIKSPIKSPFRFKLQKVQKSKITPFLSKEK